MNTTYQVSVFDTTYMSWVVLDRFRDLKEAKEYYRAKQGELWDKDDESLLCIEAIEDKDEA